MRGVQRRAGNRAAVALAARTRAPWTSGPVIQRIDDEGLADIVGNRTTKRQFDAVRKRYNDHFGSGKALADYHGAETWDYWVQKATGLSDLETKIKDVIDRAEKQRSSPVSTPVATGHSSETTLAPPPTVRKVTTTVPPPTHTGKKKKRREVLDPSLVFTATRTQQQVILQTVDAHNHDVQSLISTRPAGAIREVGPPEVSTDTVYFALTVTLPVDHQAGYPRQRIYELEIHYHPVPTSTNYLHVKIRAGTSAANTLTPTNWLLERARLQEAVVAWNAQKPGNPSLHNW
ncbi:MAG TPA: hypothetical protein VG388_14380 [Solirubrobacteraceae bacterium]|nr:hypothetical protein [Solirubrobacteraceae bacterium]